MNMSSRSLKYQWWAGGSTKTERVLIKIPNRAINAIKNNTRQP